MKVKEFLIEESKMNKGSFIFVAVAEDGKKYVVSGTHISNNPYLMPYEQSYDVIGL